MTDTVVFSQMETEEKEIEKRETDIISISVLVLAVCSLFCRGVSHACL